MVLLAILMCYLHGKNSCHGKLHAEISQNGEIHLHTPNKGLSKIKFETSPDYNSDEPPAVGPFIGNPEFVHQPEKKRSCTGTLSVASRGFVGTSLKRSYLAVNEEDMRNKIREQEESDHRMKKRTAETTDGALPWSCETKYEWKDMGADHYPRFVRTAECKSKYCVRGFYRCKPRRYKTKILRRNTTGTEPNSCEEDDVSLPDTLRSGWRFITVTINLCCDCTGPGIRSLTDI